MGMKKLVKLEQKAVKASKVVLDHCKMHRDNYYDCSQCAFADYKSKTCQIGAPFVGWNISEILHDFEEE